MNKQPEKLRKVISILLTTIITILRMGEFLSLFHKDLIKKILKN